MRSLVQGHNGNIHVHRGVEHNNKPVYMIERETAHDNITLLGRGVVRREGHAYVPVRLGLNAVDDGTESDHSLCIYGETMTRSSLS